jgi:hypothetical protein
MCGYRFCRSWQWVGTSPPTTSAESANSMAVPCGHYCHALFDGKWMLDIAIEPESVRLVIGAV